MLILMEIYKFTRQRRRGAMNRALVTTRDQDEGAMNRAPTTLAAFNS
jgi:hypothetical protein